MSCEAKREARKYYKQLLTNLSSAAREAADAAIARAVLEGEEFKAADVILPYLSFGTEVDTHSIINDAIAAGKTVALPRCVPGTRLMRWYKVENLQGLEKSPIGVEEPQEDPSREQLLGTGEKMLALVPGLTFDKAGYRLGYGGGFYDTFLEAFDGVSFGLCRAAQLCDDVRAAGLVDAHDKPVDMVLTD